MYKIKTAPTTLTDWTWSETHRALTHESADGKRSLGSIRVVSIVDHNNNELYQQPWWLEARGEIDLIVTNDLKMVFVEVNRHCLVAPEQYQEGWGEAPPSLDSIHPGVTQLELPRGFSRRIQEEAREETGFETEFIETIGSVNANTSFVGTSPLVIVYRGAASGTPSPEAFENIMNVRLLSPARVAQLKTLCGFTKAALWEFYRWGLSQYPDSLWHRFTIEMTRSLTAQ